MVVAADLGGVAAEAAPTGGSPSMVVEASFSMNHSLS